jgi:hypothetical protein
MNGELARARRFWDSARNNEGDLKCNLVYILYIEQKNCEPILNDSANPECENSANSIP